MSFRKDFIWGTGTSSFQVEGAAYEDGRGLSIWDTFCTDTGIIREGHTGEIACDHYHRYREDVALMKELGVKSYRFSISWTRILPNGIGEVNQKGIDFYNNLINCLLENGITPCITLFHWDYPLALQRLGAWSNPESSEWFRNYADIVSRAFGDRVKLFVPFNEPQCFLGMGYYEGYNAPGMKSTKREFMHMLHNTLIAHGKAVMAIRANVPDAIIGYAPTCGVNIPVSDSEADVEAARAEYFSVHEDNPVWNVALWSDPIMLGHYPEDEEGFKALRKYLPEGYEKDFETIHQPLDFYGQNIYNGSLWKADENGKAQWVPNPVGHGETAVGWPVTPDALYWGPKFLYERYGKPIIITENGMACHDIISLDGKVHDPNRIDFTHRYLLALKRAAEDGVDVMGYYYWSIMDNFEWGSGYSKRFGLVYIDYPTQERHKKDSFYWYKDVIAENGENL